MAAGVAAAAGGMPAALLYTRPVMALNLRRIMLGDRQNAGLPVRAAGNGIPTLDRHHLSSSGDHFHLSAAMSGPSTTRSLGP